jgi:hypothetical protein
MSDPANVKIFIASSGELETERKESVLLITELNKRHPHLQLEPVLFEFDTPSGNVQFKERIQDGINPILRESHITIVLFYTKAGEFTIEELELAIKLNKKVFVYFKDGFTPQNIEELNKYSKVLELKSKMDAESVLRYQKYKTPVDFNGLLYKDLDKYLYTTYPAPANAPPATVSTSRQHIPLAPRPYLAHPYSIVKNFTGRREEMTKLTEWYKYDKEPMCIIEAIGGMGKSALCWKWLQDEIIATETKVEGIIWWSFYDQSFEDFIHHLYEYCIPENIRNQPQRIDETTEVIKALTSNRFLLVLDGFERVLSGYAQMMAMYIQEQGLSKKNIEDIKEAFDIRQRTPITPKAEKLLRALCTGDSKTLMTTRLFPATIEELAGINHIKLTGLSKTDTIAFFKTEGITGTDEEMIQAGEVYGFHPLMLKLLSTAIKRSFTKNIKKALSEAFSKNLIDQREPQKILATSYNLLNADEQKVVATLSVFRTVFTLDAADSLFPDMEAEKLETIMMELCNLGFLLYNEQQRIFDFHPILRSYLYDNLTSKDKAHQLAIIYFTALPSKEKVITLSDLDPVIEQYYHLVRAEKYNDAFNLYYNRLSNYLFYQLAQYSLCISLSRQLFQRPDGSLPQLSNHGDKSYILNHLGLCYGAIGQLNEANKSMTNKIVIDYKANIDIKLGSGLQNLSDLVYVPSGKISNGVIYFLKSVILLKGEDPFREALSYIALGELLTARACYITIQEEHAIAEFLNKAMEYGTSKNENGVLSSCALVYTKLALEQINDKDKKHFFQTEALNWGFKVMKYSDQFRIATYPALTNFLYSYEAISRALIAAMQFKVLLPVKTWRVFFYDEHFQHILDTVIPDINNYSTLAERCVQEGLTLSRRINQVFRECIFSLLYARLEWQKIIDNEKEIEHFTEVEKWVNDTHSLAERIGYRMLLTDLHLFCAETLIGIEKLKLGYKKILLNLSATEHIAKAREYAIDTSTIDDIFLPPDGTADEFYKDIPEYTMLKRGMTDEERIKKGYYAAWLRADKLEKRLK